MSVNNSLSASRASVVHFVVDYDCQPPVVEIESPSIPTPGNTAALCDLTLNEAVPLWLEPTVSLQFDLFFTVLGLSMVSSVCVCVCCLCVREFVCVTLCVRVYLCVSELLCVRTFVCLNLCVWI